MKPISLEDVCKAVKGKFVCGGERKNVVVINGVTTDSRKAKDGCLFVPLKGENFDGHDFIASAFENGASCVITEREEDYSFDMPVIYVNSTHQALKDLAEYYMSLFKIPVVAITGSSGKTTTKDMVASVLAQKFNVLKTDGNFNNEIGLPLTVFNIDENTQCAVLEMGMNQFGEIHNLSKIACPDVCLITNIGVAHILNLGSREGILKAKSEIFDFMKQNGTAVLCGDDDMLITLNDKLDNIIYYGLSSNEGKNKAYATDIKENGFIGVSFVCNYKCSSFSVNLNAMGKHMVSNALAAASVGFLLGLSEEQIKKGLESFAPSKMRMDVKQNKANGITVINDTYNANPESMKASLDVLAGLETESRKVCILGDMLELGNLTDQFNIELGQHIVALNTIDCVVCVGNNVKAYEAVGEGFMRSKRKGASTHHFAKQESLIENLPSILKQNDIVLVKGSRGAGLEKTVKAILEMI